MSMSVKFQVHYKGQKNTYSRENLTDNNDKTAWVEGSLDSEVGNKIREY
ncbi:hypothetical protein [Aquimarina sp. AU58]|nr:hypothetical protein [Aquimarina sp. AU58]